MDTDPDFVRYWHFCGTIIDIHTDRNPYKGVPRTISDKGVVIYEYVIFKNILYLKRYWYRKTHKKLFFLIKKNIYVFICRKSSYFHVFLIFPVLDDNKCYRYILCVKFLSVCYFELFVILQISEFDLHKTTKQWNSTVLNGRHRQFDYF